MNLSFPTKIAMALGASLLVLGLSSVDSYRTIDRLIEDAQRETRAQQTIAFAQQLHARIDFAEEWLKSYLHSGSPLDLQQYRRARLQLDAPMKMIESRIAKPETAESARRLYEAVAERAASLDGAVPVPSIAGGIAFSRAQLDEWRDLNWKIDALLEQFKHDVAKTPAGRDAHKSGEAVKGLILWGGILSLVLMLAATLFVVRYERRRQRAELELQDAETISRAVTESMAEGVITTMSDGLIVSVNRAAVEMFRFSAPDEMIGLNVTDLVPLRQRADFVNLIAALAARADNFRETGFETRAIRRDGQEFPAKVSFGDVYAGGKRLITGIIRDMSRRVHMTQALRASESQLRLITDAVPALMYYANADRRIQFHNRLFREWFGLADGEIQNRTIADVLGPDLYDVVSPKIDEVLSGYPVRFERSHRTAGGSIKDLAVHYYPHYDESDERGRVVGYFALLTDITELKRIDRMKSEFVSTVSHELRTPLTSIRGSLGLISGGVAGPMPQSAKALLDIAQNNCERLIRLINDMLDSEKIESGKMDFDFRDTDIKVLLEQALAANEGFARQHNVAFVLSAPTRPLMARVDADRLTQVVTNLVSNAVKFSPSGGSVQVSLTRVAGSVRVEVRDNGPGIPEAFHARIFQKFSQADSSDTRLKGGTGLGLNISRAIVERHSGRIGFTTEADVGTTFHFEIPEAAAQAAMPARPQILVCDETGDIARILHVEDDPDVRQVAAAIVGDFASFDFAATLKEARERLSSQQYDLVLLDLALPDGSGWSLMEQIEGTDPQLPVVVFSASEIGAVDAQRAAAVLVKAQTSNELLSKTIHRALDERLMKAA
jgi:PAS domain S-box-containing protein